MQHKSLVWTCLSVVVASVLLGGLTSFAQGALPESFSSVANSASGWTVLIVVIVFLARFRPSQAALAAAVSFVLLVVGYTIASELRALSYSPTRWAVIGVVAGPFIGLATAWLRGRGTRAALGTAVIASVLIGDGLHGLTVLGETTSAVYWSTAIIVGVGLLAVMLAWRVRGAVPIAMTIIATIVGSGVLLGLYHVLDSV